MQVGLLSSGRDGSSLTTRNEICLNTKCKIMIPVIKK